ncbi:MAG: tetratricopeptide repeat protein [Desulfobacterales bacterium]|nr:tetratricopeptide repeat protein [Desulfobacterales bacterium]
MPHIQRDPIFPRAGVVLLLFVILLGAIYANTLGASWHLDDYANITFNPKLHVTRLTPEAVYRSFSAYRNKPIRPVSCLTLALNWRFGQDNVAGYHVVNIAIHVLSAWFLFLAIFHLLRTPNLEEHTTPGDRYFIALLAATLWAVNPIQTQAVTYIVQRMAALAALFYILGVLCYVKARLAGAPGRRWGWSLGCLFSFLLGLGSKENAAMLPIALTLVEFMFFQDLGRPRTRKIFLGILAGGGLLIVILGGALFLRGDLTSVLNGYQSRPFTPMERVLTQPRVLIFYLSQIFYPTPGRLSIEHDIDLSTSLLAPWSTLPAILIVLGLIALGVSLMRRRPLIGFGILFFFLNHLLESSIIPLEMVFEHRNYLPSMFLFPPVAAGLKALLDRYPPGERRPMRAILISFITLLIVGFGVGACVRNMTWATEKSLWEDAIEKAPKSGRPYHNLAKGHFEKKRRLHAAIALYKKASGLYMSRTDVAPQSVYNIGVHYYTLKDYRQSERWFQKALEIASSRGREMITHRLAFTLIRKGDLAGALTLAERLTSKAPGKAEYLNLKGIVLFQLSRPWEALACFRKSFCMDRTQTAALVNAGATLKAHGSGRRAALLLKAADRLQPGKASTRLWLLEAVLAAGEAHNANHYVDRLFQMYSVHKLSSILNQFSRGEYSEKIVSLPPSDMLIFRTISYKLKEKSEKMLPVGYSFEQTGPTEGP